MIQGEMVMLDIRTQTYARLPLPRLLLLEAVELRHARRHFLLPGRTAIVYRTVGRRTNDVLVQRALTSLTLGPQSRKVNLQGGRLDHLTQVNFRESPHQGARSGTYLFLVQLGQLRPAVDTDCAF